MKRERDYIFVFSLPCLFFMENEFFSRNVHMDTADLLSDEQSPDSAGR